jgi:hypothetical protein
MALSPVSFQFVAAGAAIQAKGALYRFKPSRTGQSPSWDGRKNSISPFEIKSPITDKSFWSGRYALCELIFENSKGKRLVMNDAIVAISRSKNIVTTQLVGMNGTVKEYINDGDYSLNIIVGVAAVRDGVIVDEYPADGLRELRAFLDDNEALDVYSEFLDVFDINSIVVKSFSVSQDTASNYQSVSISAVSDKEYNIYSTDY